MIYVQWSETCQQLQPDNNNHMTTKITWQQRPTCQQLQPDNNNHLSTMITWQKNDLVSTSTTWQQRPPVTLNHLCVYDWKTRLTDWAVLHPLCYEYVAYNVNSHWLTTPTSTATITFIAVHMYTLLKSLYHNINCTKWRNCCCFI